MKVLRYSHYSISNEAVELFYVREFLAYMHEIYSVYLCACVYCFLFFQFMCIRVHSCGQ